MGDAAGITPSLLSVSSPAVRGIKPESIAQPRARPE
jgi:hypothetical protein